MFGANHASFGICGEGITHQVESNGGHANIEEVLGYDIHLVAFADLASFEQHEAKLHQDDVNRGDDDPILKQSVL